MEFYGDEVPPHVITPPTMSKMMPIKPKLLESKTPQITFQAWQDDGPDAIPDAHLIESDHISRFKCAAGLPSGHIIWIQEKCQFKVFRRVENALDLVTTTDLPEALSSVARIFSHGNRFAIFGGNYGCFASVWELRHDGIPQKKFIQTYPQNFDMHNGKYAIQEFNGTIVYKTDRHSTGCHMIDMTADPIVGKSFHLPKYQKCPVLFPLHLTHNHQVISLKSDSSDDVHVVSWNLNDMLQKGGISPPPQQAESPDNEVEFEVLPFFSNSEGPTSRPSGYQPDNRIQDIVVNENHLIFFRRWAIDVYNRKTGDYERMLYARRYQGTERNVCILLFSHLTPFKKNGDFAFHF